MQNSFRAQKTIENAERTKAVSMFRSKMEAQFYNYMELLTVVAAFCVAAPKRVDIKRSCRIAEPHRQVSVLKSDAMTIDVVVCENTKEMALYGNGIDETGFRKKQS